MSDIHILSAVRTPVGKAPRGTLKHTRPDEMAATVIAEAIKRVSGLAAEQVDDVILGCAMPEAEQGMNVARISLLRAGLPKEFSKKMSDAMRSGEFRPVDVRQAMISLMTMSLGYFLMSQIFNNVWQVAGEPAFIEERKKAIVDLFMNGVKAR